MAEHRGGEAGRGGRARDDADHPDRRQRLLNRLAIGSGVLCGLRLESDTQRTLRLGPGVALDPRGRELVMDEPVTIHPHHITDEAGDGVEVIESGVVTIALTHRRRPPEGDREAEDAVAVLILKGDRERARTADDLCGLIAPPRQARAESPELRLARFLQASEGDCFDADGPAYVVLGRVILGRDGLMTIDAAGAAGRRLVVSNSVLLDLVLCLWDRLEMQTGGHPSPPPHSSLLTTPKATPPRPAPHPATLWAPQASPPPRAAPGPAPAYGTEATATRASLRVVGVEFLDEWGRPQGSLDRLIRPARFPAARGIGAIQVTFSQPLDPGTCTAIEPAAASILVRSDRGTGPDGHVPGTVSVQGNVARYQVDGGHTAFPAGEYEVTLYGDEDPDGRRPAIAARDRSRLDGEARTLPSGDGREGGNFVFRLRIGDD